MKRVFAGVLLAAGLARAEAPSTVPLVLPHQGRLLDAADQPVTATQDVTFSLYKQASGGSPVWTETRKIAIQNGFYSVLLGEAQDAPATPSPLDPKLFGEQLFLGIQPAGAQGELSPRLKLGTVPYALRADLAGRMVNGSIEGGTIHGADVDAVGLKINGTQVIDASGTYVGQSSNALKLGGVDAAAYQQKADAQSTFVLKAGDQMTGDLGVQGRVSAQQLVSTATSGAPFVVNSSDLVPGLNAEMVGGRRAADLLTVGTFTEANLDNRVQNGSFERGTDGQLPASFEPYGAGTTGSRGLVSGQGRYGTRVLQVSDSDINQTLAAKQTLVPVGQAAQYAGVRFTASVWAKRVGGSATGTLCIADKGADDAEPAGNKDCVDLAGSTDWARATVTHQVAANADYVVVILNPTKNKADTASYQFDALAVNTGPFAPAWAPNPTEQLFDGGVQTEKLADAAITSAKIAPNAITTDKIADGAVGTADIAAGAITGAKLASDVAGLVQVSGGALSIQSGNLVVNGNVVAGGTAQGNWSGFRSTAAAGTWGFQQNDQMYVGVGGNVYNRGFSTGAMGIFNGSASTKQDVFLYDQNAPGADFVVLKNNGNFGVNVANPQRTLDVSGSLSTQNGQDQRNVLTFMTTEQSNIPIHIKTNWRTNNSAMYRFLVEGYNYGRGLAINSDCVGYLYSATDSVYNGSCNQYAGGVSLSQYRSSDGYLVLRVDPISTNYYIGFGLSVQQFNPTGVQAPLQFTVVRQAANL